MRYQAPSMLADGEEVAHDRARTEILAQAFADAAGGYFDRLKRYEDNIADAEDEQARMKKFGAGAVGAGVVVFAFGTVGGRQPSPIVALFGLVITIAGGIYSYKRHTNAEDRIERNEQDIVDNEPDGEVTFVSRISVPLYLVPYEDSHMVFDGLNTAPETTLDLANIDGDALIDAQDELVSEKRTFDEYLGSETVLSPDELAEYAPDVAEHRQPERPITEKLDAMTAIAQDIERDTITVNIHANNHVAESIQQLAREDHLEWKEDLRMVRTPTSMSDSEAVVDEIRGVEEQAVSGDMLGQARQARTRVDEIATDLTTRLRGNSQQVTDHYDGYAEELDTTVNKHVCVECLADRVEAVTDELGLVDQLLSSETGSLGTALNDRDLDRETDEAFRDRIRADIEEVIPEIDDELNRSYNRLDDLGPAGGYCEVHEDVETREVADSGALFGEVWRSLYYEFRQPVMGSVEDLEKEAEEIRQNKEQKMIDLTQYEQIKDEAEQRYFEVKSEYETAQAIERQLR